MKKSKLLILGLIALMLAGGLILASCDINFKCEQSGQCIVNSVGVISCGMSDCSVAKKCDELGITGPGYTYEGSTVKCDCK